MDVKLVIDDNNIVVMFCVEQTKNKSLDHQ